MSSSWRRKPSKTCENLERMFERWCETRLKRIFGTSLQRRVRVGLSVFGVFVGHSIDYGSKRYGFSTMFRKEPLKSWRSFRNPKPQLGLHNGGSRNEESSPIRSKRRPVEILATCGKGRSAHYPPRKTSRRLGWF